MNELFDPEFIYVVLDELKCKCAELQFLSVFYLNVLGRTTNDDDFDSKMLKKHRIQKVIFYPLSHSFFAIYVG